MRILPIAMVWLALSAPAAAQEIESLERALETARNNAPLALEPFLPVARPAKYYGNYESRPNAVYRSGEKMYFYLEPKNLVMRKDSHGLYEPAFEVDLEVQPVKGGTPLKQAGFAKFRLPTRSRVQDIYLNLTLSLDRAPAGDYAVRFTVRDKNSSKAGTVEQVVTLR